MARVLTNNVGLRYVVETALGTPGTTGWRLLEPNTIGAYGAAITTVERRPIAATRGRKKGTVTDLDSTVEFEGDLTMDSFADFAEGFVFSEFANTEFDLRESNGPPSVDGTTDDFDIDAASALLAGKIVHAATGARTLVFSKGYSESANNGLHVVNADTAPSGTAVQVATDLTTEASPPANASCQVCGVEIDTGDVTFTLSGSTATLVSAAHVANWSTLGLRAGMYIHIGSRNPSTGNPQNAFDDSGTDDVYGFARITSISGGTLNLDKLDTKLSATDTNTGVLHVLFGRYLRNVATTADSDDNRYVERSYHFEAEYPDLGGSGTDEYEYAIGNFANEMALNIPLTEKATVSWGFIGTNSDDITGTRKTGASAAVSPLRTTAVNTSSDIVSLTTDLITLASDVCFKSLTVTLRNNVSPEKCVGTLGAVYVNTGLFEVNLEGQALFTNKEITNAIKGNTTTTFAAILSNDDGGIAIDIPSLTFGGGGREFPVDASVLVNLTGIAFNDPTGTIPDVSLGISLFADLPTNRP